MMRIRAAAILLVTSLLPLASLAGDDPLTNRGVNLNSVYHVGDIDTVNLFNGNLIIDVPMAAQFPLNGGFSYGIHLVYTGQPWDFPQYQREDPDLSHPPPREWIWKPLPIPNRRSNAGVGWRVSMGRLIPPWDPTNTNCDRGTFDGCANWVYESPDGADHRVGGTDPGYSADGSYLRLKSYTNNGTTYREIEFSDGMIHRFNDTGNLTAIYTPFDRAANAGPSVNVAYLTGASSCGDAGAESCWKISDLFGRTQYVTFVSTSGAIYDHQLAQKIIVTAPGSATVAYSLHYTPVNLYLDKMICYLSPDDTDGRWKEPEYYSVPLLTSIVLPDGSDYQFTTYHNEPPECSQGSISSLTLPTKGSIAYTYTNWAHNHRGSPVETGHGSPYVPGVNDRTKTPVGGPAKVWIYESKPGDNAELPCEGCPNPPHEDRERKVTVTDPDGRAVRHYFSIADNAETGGWTRYEYGLPLTHRAGTSTTDPSNGQTRYLSSEVLDAAGSVERSTYVKYEYELGESDARPGRYPREQASLTRYADGTGHDAGRWSSVNRSSFDYFGHYRQTETDGNFASEGNTNFDNSIEFTDFNPGKSAFDGWLVASPWVLNTFDMQTVTTPKIGPNDALTSHTKKTEFCFEANTGFLTRRRVLRYDPTTRSGSGRDVTDLITAFGRFPEHSDANPSDTTGNLYSERSYGGDGATLVDGSLCSVSLTSPRYEIQHRYLYGVRKTSQYFHSDGTAMPFFTLDRTIDLSGAVSKERDIAGIETTYTPDPDHPLQIQTVSTTGSDPISYVYSNASVSGSTLTPAQIAVTQSDISSSVQYDSFGRMWHEFRTMPTIGQVKRETLYDSSNRKLSQSMWDSSSYTNKTTYTYDFLGRLDSVTPPDGQIVRTSYLGDSKRTTTSEVVTSTDATPAKTTVSTVEKLDRYGRIWYLKEPNDTVTAYGYGVTGALARVCMNTSLISGVLSTASCGQERTFDYDNAGLLKKETHPENGAVSYTYDALGHILTKSLSTAGIFDLKYTYDDAARLKEVDSRQSATSEDFRVSKFFEFGTNNDGSNKKLGKLETATRHNYRPVAGGADIDIRVIETYAYKDTGGRLTDRTTEIKDMTTSGGISQTVTQKQDYTALGLVNSITYPSCLSGVACGEATSASVALTHTNGWLTSIDPPSSYASLLYHANGMINTVSHGNGVTDTQANDPHGMPRPESITFDSFGSCVKPALNGSPNPTLDSAVIQWGASKSWSVSASGSATLLYQWYKDGHALAEVSSTLNTGPLYDGPHSYFVRVANSCGMVQSNTATITIAVPPSITVQPQDTTFSAPSVRLTVAVSTSTSPTPDYQWYRGAGPNDPAKTPVGNQSYFDTPNLTATTKYFVHVSNVGGFADSRTATVTVALSTPCCLTAAMPNTPLVQPVHLSWGASSSGTDHYEIWRREHAGVLHKIGESGSTSYDDTSAAADTAYFYQVCASPAPGAMCTSGFSNQDLATTVAFRDITVDRRVRLVDLTQLLTAVNAVRGASGGSDGTPVTWAGILHSSPAPALNGLVYGEHVMALRAQMELALLHLGFSQHTYADLNLPSSPRVIIKAIHITELRDRIQ
jgi:YD repeat-containing protein